MEGVQMMFGEAAAIIEQGEEEKYQAFVDKFKKAKTTDDCYTPTAIYDAVVGWVEEEYGIDKARFIRPFKPGGDYQREEYPAGCAVVDNPPFSILAQIVDFYIQKGLKFFLFGPTLTMIGLMKKAEREKEICILLTGAKLEYENGALVNTSFVTNMDKYALRIEAELFSRIERAR